MRQSLIVREADTARLADIRCPTLVVAGAEDQLRSPEEARELADGIPSARLEIVPGAGHLIPLEQPQALAGAIARHVGAPAEAG
jgi:pimeloyl-ACP methyl ester carboxylesterase